MKGVRVANADPASQGWFTMGLPDAVNWVAVELVVGREDG